MSALTDYDVNVRLAIDDTRTGKLTNFAILALDALPSFTHKWSKARRSYHLDELLLPSYIYVKGAPPNWNLPLIAFGGTRSPAVESFCIASRVSEYLASNHATIISGGVPGIDLAGHLAAVAVGGSSFAVLANPVNMGLRGHEWSNPLLETEMLRRGGFISEYIDRVDVLGSEFLERLLQRDRIISGLCDVFLVFECRENSATVDTAKRAHLQGKKVICIDSGRRTARVGLYQLVEELGLSLLSADKMSVDSIGESIIECLE